VLRALDLGALGFIPKSAPRDVMVNALRLVFSGGIYIPPEALVRAEAKAAQPVPARPVSPADLGFTERQMEVLALMMLGKSNKAISHILDVAEPTVMGGSCRRCPNSRLASDRGLGGRDLTLLVLQKLADHGTQRDRQAGARFAQPLGSRVAPLRYLGTLGTGRVSPRSAGRRSSLGAWPVVVPWVRAFDVFGASRSAG
jgi:hypothetical protein